MAFAYGFLDAYFTDYTDYEDDMADSNHTTISDSKYYPESNSKIPNVSRYIDDEPSYSRTVMKPCRICGGLGYTRTRIPAAPNYSGIPNEFGSISNNDEYIKEVCIYCNGTGKIEE